MSVAGMVTVMDGPETGPFNLGNPTEFTMLELAKMVQEVVNPGVKIVYKENTADDPSRRKPDITKVLSPVPLLVTIWQPAPYCTASIAVIRIPRHHYHCMISNCCSQLVA